MNTSNTKLVKLDLDVILKNYNKPEFWKKNWLIYRHNEIVIYARLASIDLVSNLITMDIYFDRDRFVNKKINKIAFLHFQDHNSFIIPIDHDKYSKENFEHDVLSHALQLINILEERYIEDYNEYRQAEKLEDKSIVQLTKIAEKILDDNKVTNDDIRKAYITSYISKCYIPTHTFTVIKNMEYTVIPNEYLLLISYFNNKHIYTEYSMRCKKIRKSIKAKLWSDGRKLDTDEFVEKMKENLENV